MTLQPLPTQLLSAAWELDRQVLGGLWNLQAYRQELARDSSDLIGIWPLADPSQLLALGCAWSILEEAHLVLLAVHPTQRQRSLGYAVFLGLLELARRRGNRQATLEVKASNQAAIALYTKLGFTTAGRRPKYYSDTGEDALVMWRSGLQSFEFAQELASHWQTVAQRWQNWQSQVAVTL
ncbi:MAG: ribosomal protein S18-alanine N-acetyltransferase [Thermosynechococcaceae cyanobacterium]